MITGKTVYHCHILEHEDLGMRGTLMINSYLF
ncbi:multicopper oxidase domain-containing protein [Crocosphaera sp.]|nr:multicopper oxidase domain-containing protein [Crocosphaera sp.]